MVDTPNVRRARESLMEDSSIAPDMSGIQDVVRRHTGLFSKLSEQVKSLRQERATLEDAITQRDSLIVKIIADVEGKGYELSPDLMKELEKVAEVTPRAPTKRSKSSGALLRGSLMATGAVGRSKSVAVASVLKETGKRHIPHVLPRSPSLNPTYQPPKKSIRPVEDRASPLTPRTPRVKFEESVKRDEASQSSSANQLPHVGRRQHSTSSQPTVAASPQGGHVGGHVAKDQPSLTAGNEDVVAPRMSIEDFMGVVEELKQEPQGNTNSSVKLEPDLESELDAPDAPRRSSSVAELRRRSTISKDDLPPPLPEGWQEVFDPLSGKFYFFHEQSNTTTWDRPKAEDAIDVKFLDSVAKGNAKLVVVIQSVARMVMMKARYKKMIKRNKIAREILDTETSYCKQLMRLDTKYRVPLLEKLQGDALEPQVTSVFGNLPMVLNVSCLLLDELYYRIERPVQVLGDIFWSLAPLLQVYAEYINNYNDALATLKTLQNSPKFALALEQCETEGGSDLALTSLLIMPIQRIPRYQLLLQELLKYTPMKHADYEETNKALAAVRTLAECVNESKRASENMKVLADIERELTTSEDNVSKLQFVGILAQPHRKFLRRSSLMMLNDGMFRSNTVACELILFSDVLIHTTKRIIGNSTQVQGVAKLTALNLQQVDSADRPFCLQLDGCGSGKFTIVFERDEDRTSWWSDIISAQKEMATAYSKRGKSIFNVREDLDGLAAEIAQYSEAKKSFEDGAMDSIESICALNKEIDEYKKERQEVLNNHGDKMGAVMTETIVNHLETLDMLISSNVKKKKEIMEHLRSMMGELATVTNRLTELQDKHSEHSLVKFMVYHQ